MKKLLSILAAVGLTATASMSVVACGKKDKAKADTKDLTSTIFQNSPLGKLTAEGVLQDLMNSRDYGTVFGDPGVAAKQFMNYFAEAIMHYIDKNISLLTDPTHSPINKDAMKYVDDGVFQVIKNDWESQSSNATDAWNKKVSDAKNQYGKKWKDNLLSDLQKQFGKNIYGTDGKLESSTDYTDYKSLFISYTILNGETNGKSLYDSLKDDIYLWGGTPVGTDITSLLNIVSSQLFSKKVTADGKSIDFVGNHKGGQDAYNSADPTSMVGQMQNFIQGVKADTTANKDTYAGWLADMYNITGGLNAKLDSNGKLVNSDDGKSFDVANIKWATTANVADAAIGSDNGKAAAQDLIHRLDSNFDNDYGTTNAVNTSISTLQINSAFNIKGKVSSIYNESQPAQLGSQINGLYSNAQRYVANDYYQNEKPVAVSELVISPLYGTPDYSQIISNGGYIPSQSSDNPKMLYELYALLGNFINKGVASDYGSASTDGAIANTGDYSWDQLMENISGTWPSDINTTNAADWNGDSTFKGKVKFTEHDNLLTMDSPSSDYSDLLKYSVYDYLSKGKNAKEYSDWTAAPSGDLPPTSVSAQQLDDLVKGDGNKGEYDKAYNTVTSLITSLSRTSTSTSMYQVVNAKQGIIAFMDKDGLHFVRVEGNSILNNADSKAPLLKDQTPLSTSNFKDATKADAAKNDYYAAQVLNSEITGSSTNDVKNSAAKITSDYADADVNQQSITGLKYSDLNKGFGNSYLQFLANSSMPKSMGFATPKYNYDLNSLLKSYCGPDISASNITSSTTMTLMVWDYFETLFNVSDTQMFNWVVNGGDGNPSDSKYKPSEKTNTATIFDPIERVAGSDSSTVKEFQDFYMQYIINGVIGKNSSSKRANHAKYGFEQAWEKSDEDIADTKWTNPQNDKWESKLQWNSTSSAPSGDKQSLADGADTPVDTTKYYKDAFSALDKSDMWKPDDSSSTKQNEDIQTNVASSFLTSDSKINYQVKVEKFAVNKFALKGKED